MGGEPQPGGGPDALGRALQAQKLVWFGLFAGAVSVCVLMVGIVTSGGGPQQNFGEAGYLFLLTVPAALVMAYGVVPGLVMQDPANLVRAARAVNGLAYPGWDAARPEDAYYWFPVYARQMVLRSAMLEGGAIPCAIGFFLTADWAILGGAVVLIAALLTEVPTRSGAEAFATAARDRQSRAG
jgi:hypothetical protein